MYNTLQDVEAWVLKEEMYKIGEIVMCRKSLGKMVYI